VLAQRPGTRFGLDDVGVEFATRRSREIAIALEKQQVDVVGDLEELIPASEAVPGQPPISRGLPPVADDVLLRESINAIVGLLEEHHDRRTEREAARRDHADGLQQLKQQPVRYLLRRESERRPWLMKVRNVYRRRQAVTRRLRRRHTGT